MKFAHYVFVIPIIGVFASCKNETENIDRNEKKILVIDQPIRDTGLYTTTDSLVSLKIDVINNLVNFSILNKRGEVLYQHGRPGVSDYQKWFFLLDSSRNIWLNSSDVGTMVIKLNADQGYRLLEWYGQDSIIEKSTFRKLPVATQKLFGAYAVKAYSN